MIVFLLKDSNEVFGNSFTATLMVDLLNIDEYCSRFILTCISWHSCELDSSFICSMSKHFCLSKALANYVLASFGKRVSRALYVSGCPLIELFGEWCGLNSLTFWAMFYMYDHYMMIWRRDAEFRHVGSSWNDSRRVRYGGISDSVTE